MALATNITRRIGSKNYYVRIFVPKSLQAKLEKAEIGSLSRPPTPLKQSAERALSSTNMIGISRDFRQSEP